MVIMCNRNSQVAVVFVRRIELSEKEWRVLAICRACSRGHMDWFVQVEAFMSKCIDKAFRGVEARLRVSVKLPFPCVDKMCATHGCVH